MPPEHPQGVPSLPEQAPSVPENRPETPAPDRSAESGLGSRQERVEQTAEAGAVRSDAASAAAAVYTTVQPAAAPTDSPVADTPVSDSPLTAADEDVIEKEWVDKAKLIISQTQGDPHARSARVNQLQRDYLQKRYGKIIGAAD